MSDAEHDVELLLDRVTPDDVEPVSLPVLRDRVARRRRRRRLAGAAATAGVLAIGAVGIAVRRSDSAEPIRAVGEGGVTTPTVTPDQAELDLPIGATQVFPSDMVPAEAEVPRYGSAEELLADFARIVLGWDAALVDVDRGAVTDPVTRRTVEVELSSSEDEGWVIERAGDRLVLDELTGDLVVPRPEGVAAIAFAYGESVGPSGGGGSAEAAAGDPTPIRPGADLGQAEIVVAASYDAEGRAIEIATARDEDLEPPPLRYPLLILDSLQLRGSVGVVDGTEPTGLMITIGDFGGDSEFEHAATLFVSEEAPWPGVIFGEVEPDPVDFGGYDADVIIEELTGERWIQVLPDELTVLIEDGPFAEQIIESMRLPEDSSDLDRVRFGSLPDTFREVARTPYGTGPTVALVSEPTDDDRGLLVYADRGPQLGRDGRFERIELGVAFGGGWLGEVPGVDGRPDSSVLTWEASWGTWLTVVASGYDDEQLIELAGAIELVDRSTWEATYGP